MWSLLVAMAWAEDLPTCLEGAVVGKGDDRGAVPALVVFEVELKNRCSREIRAYRGRIDVTGAVPGLSWSMDVASFRPAMDPGAKGSAEFQVPMGSSVAELWVVTAPKKALTMTWTPQAVVFADGTAVWDSSVQGEALRNDPRNFADRAAEVLGRMNSVPVYVVK